MRQLCAIALVFSPFMYLHSHYLEKLCYLVHRLADRKHNGLLLLVFCACQHLAYGAI